MRLHCFKWNESCFTELCCSIKPKYVRKTTFHLFVAKENTMVPKFRAFQSILMDIFCLYGLVSRGDVALFIQPWQENQTILFSSSHFLDFLQCHSNIMLGFLLNFLLAFWNVSGTGVSWLSCAACTCKLCYLYAFFCKAWFFRTIPSKRFLQKWFTVMERNLLSALSLLKKHHILCFSASNHTVKKVVDNHFPLGLQRVKSSSGINWHSSIQIRAATLIHSSWGSSP